MILKNSKISNLKIFLDGGWDAIPDIDDFNLDVHIDFDTGEHFVVTVATPKNFLTIMDSMNSDKKMNFYDDYPMIVVREMTYEIVFETLTKMLEDDDGFLLKLYIIAGYGIGDEELLDTILENEHQKSIKFNQYLESEED
jgi:hypothetical protein